MSNIALKGLQGLNLLLENEFNPTNIQASDAYLKIPIHSLIPCPFQPRKNFNENEIRELAESIKVQGIIQPVITRKAGLNKYEIIAGERRWRAAQLANLKEIPIICRELDDATVLAFALVENIQRRELNVLEEANAIKMMIDKFSYTQEEIAQMLGKGRSTITNLLRILYLNPKIIEMLSNKLLEFGHAKLLVNLDHELQLTIANEIVKKGLTIRETEKLLRSLKKINVQSVMPNKLFDERLKLWQEHLSKILHSKVDIKLNSNGKGRVVISLDSMDEIEWLLKRLERLWLRIRS